MTTPTIITNNVPRDVLDACELTAAERAEFDYLDWEAIEQGSDSASFLRYKGDLYDLAEFEPWDNPASPTRQGDWHAFRSDSFFSGIAIRYVREDDNYEGAVYDWDRIVVGMVYS